MMYLLITTNLLFVSSNIFAQGDESIKLLLMENCRILRPYEVSEFIIHDQGGSSIKGTYEVGEVHFQLQDSRYFYHSDSIVVSGAVSICPRVSSVVSQVVHDDSPAFGQDCST